MAAVWRRWKRFAHRAAEVQSYLLLFVLYFILVVPASWVMRIGGSRETHGWQPLSPSSYDLESAKNQF